MHRTTKCAAVFLAASLLAFAVTSRAAQSIPPGTIFPVVLNSTLSSAKAKPGHIVTARVMQDVPLTNGRTIRAGATILGHITSVTPASNRNPARLSLRFDTLEVSHERIPITTNLRAVASFMEVDEAQIPTMGPDRGTPQDAWTTTQIGGDSVYRGGGPVDGALGRVGTPVYDGVLDQLHANSNGGCRAAVDSNDAPQALWVFSSNACGTYSLPHLEIVHSGRTDPTGEIVLESSKGQVNVRAGAGMLLRVDATGAPSGA
ncbi:MAG: hypothetical protein WA581_12570 [Candidatus Acidiferrales bacterium]